MTLQSGVFADSGQRPPPCFRLVLLDAAHGADPASVRDALGAVSAMLGWLTEGRVRELDGQPLAHAASSAEQFAGLTHLIGYGRRLFDETVHRPPLTQTKRPDYIVYLPIQGPFPALRWSDAARRALSGEADVAIQLTAQRRAAVECAAVEIWKLVRDLGDPLRVVASFDGFGRHDGRGWLEFHDGVSNIETSQRMLALRAAADPPWMEGGTYLAFLRLAIDLEVWRALDREDQELIVGRDKRSGNALTGTARDKAGRARPVVEPSSQDDAERRQDYVDPPQTTDPLLEASHIHRANQSRASPSARAALRMFRQGYDFLDGFDATGPRLGLNFVSFQRDLSVVQHLLHLRGWLGDVSFGGRAEPRPGDPPQRRLVSVLAGGFYAVPPAEVPIPGAGLFSGA